MAKTYQDDFIIGSVNAAEVFTKVMDRNPFAETQSKNQLLAMTMKIVPFDGQQALLCADIRNTTRKFGLSLGDRACLALAIRENAVVLTADRAWAELDIGVKIKVIR